MAFELNIQHFDRLSRCKASGISRHIKPILSQYPFEEPNSDLCFEPLKSR